MLAKQSGLDRGELTIGRFGIPYAVAGDGPRCLVCVNALQQTMGAWRPFISRFGNDPRYRLVMFDFPHQGRALVRWGAADVPLMEQVTILSAVVQQFSQHAPVALTGGSWGSVIAAAYAATYPSRVRGLILGSFRTSPNDLLRSITRQGMELVNRGDAAGVGALFVEGFAKGMRPAGRERLLEQFRKLTPRQLAQMVLQGQVLLDHGDIEDFVDLTAIRARTLIVNGADDPIVDQEDAWEAACRIPDSEVRILPDVGHFLHIERPDVMDVYDDFLDRSWDAAPAGRQTSEIQCQRGSGSARLRPTS